VMRLSGSILGDEIVIGLSHLEPPLIGPQNGSANLEYPFLKLRPGQFDCVHVRCLHSSAGENHPLRPRAHPGSASCTPGAPARTACSSPTAPRNRSPKPDSSARKARKPMSSPDFQPCWVRGVRPTRSLTPEGSRSSSSAQHNCANCLTRQGSEADCGGLGQLSTSQPDAVTVPRMCGIGSASKLSPREPLTFWCIAPSRSRTGRS
jgi:hypothetical protein